MNTATAIVLVLIGKLFAPGYTDGCHRRDAHDPHPIKGMREYRQLEGICLGEKVIRLIKTENRGYDHPAGGHCQILYSRRDPNLAKVIYTKPAE